MKPDPLRTGANALRYWEERQQVVSHNLANAETNGFKAERIFAQLLGDTVTTSAATDMRAGSLVPTGGSLDLALEGDGFFVVSTADGERLTRAGSFRVDEQGRITDAAGNPLLGEDGELLAPRGTIEIDETGVVRVDAMRVGRLRIVEPAAGAGMLHEEAARFRVDGELTPVEGARVKQGFLERSNVDALQSMVEMIEIQRAYGSVQNSMRTMDGIMDRVANQLGRLT